jgi:hypothetical protein
MASMAQMQLPPTHLPSTCPDLLPCLLCALPPIAAAPQVAPTSPLWPVSPGRPACLALQVGGQRSRTG